MIQPFSFSYDLRTFLKCLSIF